MPGRAAWERVPAREVRMGDVVRRVGQRYWTVAERDARPRPTRGPDGQFRREHGESVHVEGLHWSPTYEAAYLPVHAWDVPADALVERRGRQRTPGTFSNDSFAGKA